MLSRMALYNYRSSDKFAALIAVRFDFGPAVDGWIYLQKGRAGVRGAIAPPGEKI